ncbi:MAG: hypothetical protein RR910_08605 [Acidaminococcaceae bacterium]
MINFIETYWQPALYSLLSCFVVWIGKVVVATLRSSMERQDKQDMLLRKHSEGMRVLLYDRLYQACKYHLKRGYISIEELKNLEHLYTAYHDEGGNGTGTEMFNRCKALKLRGGDEVVK